MYELYVDDSLESKIARYICAVKQIPVHINTNEEELKRRFKEYTLPLWLEPCGFYIQDLFCFVGYLNDRFPCRDIVPVKGYGDLQNRYAIYQMVSSLLKDTNEWRHFTFVDNCKMLLSPLRPTLLDAVLIPILANEEDIPPHLDNYVNVASQTTEYKFSTGEIGNELTEGYHF